MPQTSRQYLLGVKKAFALSLNIRSLVAIIKNFLQNIKKYYLMQLLLCLPFAIFYAICQYWNGGLSNDVGFLLTMILAFLSILATYRYYWSINSTQLESKSIIRKVYSVVCSSGDRLYTGLFITLIMLISLSIYMTSFVLFINFIGYVLGGSKNILVIIAAMAYVPFFIGISRLYFGLLSLPFELYMSKMSFKNALLSSWDNYQNYYFLFATLANVIGFSLMLVIVLLLSRGQSWIGNVLQNSFQGGALESTVLYISYILVLNLYLLYTKSIYEHFSKLSNTQLILK